MDSRSFIILVFFSYFKAVSVHPNVVYKPTDLSYSRCFEKHTNKITCERLNISKVYQQRFVMSLFLYLKSFNPKIDEQSHVMIQKEIGSAILEYQDFKFVRMKRELIPVGKMRSIQEILSDDRCLSVSFVVTVSKQLAEYLRILHESFITIDQINETNIYITVCKTEGSKPIVVIDANTFLAADESVLQDNIRQYGNLVRKLLSKCKNGGLQ